MVFLRVRKLFKSYFFAEELETDIKGESAFYDIEPYFKKKVTPLRNIARTTDGVPAITKCYRGCLSILKKAVPNILSMHCVIHRK